MLDFSDTIGLALVDNANLNNIAISIRAVNGESTKYRPSEMSPAIDTIGDEVDTQADLISQIATALEGKAAGGSGGAGVETCNIELSFTDFSSVQGAQYCTVNEGILNFVGDYFEDQQGHVLGGVACGSIVVVYAFAMDSSYVGDGDCTYLYGDNNLLIMIAPERSGDYAATIYGA